LGQGGKGSGLVQVSSLLSPTTGSPSGLIRVYIDYFAQIFHYKRYSVLVSCYVQIVVTI